jgi:hypothetical protein
MKKLFIGLAFLGFFSIAIPTAKAEVQPCHSIKFYCSDGKGYMAIICTPDDYDFFYSYYCGSCPQ